MSTKIYEFHGKSWFAKVYDRGDEKYENWHVNVILDKSSQALFDKSGLRLKPHKTREGETFYSFKRPWKKLFGIEIVNFDPPEVFDDFGNPITDLIGNGSEIFVRVSVYDTRMGKAHRLETVHVKKLVPYGNKDGTPELIRPDDVDLPPLE